MKNHSRILSLLLAAVLLLGLGLSAGCASADGEGSNWSGSAIWDQDLQCYLFDNAHYGVVICRQMTVREKPSTSGKEYAKIGNSQPMKVVGFTQNEDWYVIDLGSIGIDNGIQYGYGKASLIKLDPQWIYSDKTLPLYATPWSRDKRNGEQGNRYFLVIDQYNGWYAVQTQESSPGTSFVRSSDVPQYSLYYQSQYVINWECPCFDEQSWAVLQTIKRNTVGTVIGEIDDFYMVVFNAGTEKEFRGWINKEFCGLIIN